MKTMTFSIIIFSVIILMVSYPFGCAAQKDVQESNTDSLADTTKAVVPSDEELEKNLIEVGTDIAEMILEKDALGLLKYVGKAKESVSYFPDIYKSFEQVEADLSDTNSVKYCQLFNIICYNRSDIGVSVYEFLLEGKTRDMKVAVEIFHEATMPDFRYGIVRYKWQGMPEAYKKEPLSTNYFVWTDEGWMFSTLFSWY